MKHYAHAVACVIAIVYFTCFVPADAVQLDRKKLAVASNHGLLKKVHKLVKRSAKGDGNHAKKVVKDQDRVHHTLKAAAIGKTQKLQFCKSIDFDVDVAPSARGVAPSLALEVRDRSQLTWRLRKPRNARWP